MEIALSVGSKVRRYKVKHSSSLTCLYHTHNGETFQITIHDKDDMAMKAPLTIENDVVHVLRLKEVLSSTVYVFLNNYFISFMYKD